MAKGQTHIVMDNYIADLLQQIVNQGKASNFPDVIGKLAAEYLGIHYKSKDERKLEQERDRILELGKRILGV